MDTYAAAGARPAYTTLQSLAALLEGEGLLASTEHIDPHAATPISGADCDSRVAAQNHLFVCKGAAFKPAYLLSAVEKGAVACLCDANLAPALREACPQLPMLVATDLRRAMALASAEAWGHPDRAINVLGITGTKGKSTVAYMLRHILDGKTAGSGTGIMGSIDTYDGIEDFESVNTTPESPDLWRHLANTRDAGLASMVMEVSSQALKYDRVTGLKIDVACFLNLGRDHISPVEHPSFEDYFESKLRIFDQARVAVVNLDMDHAAEVLDRAQRCERVVTLSVQDDAQARGADVWASDIHSEHGGITFTVHSARGVRQMHVSMPGLFNVDNALAAIAMCEVMDVPDEQIAAGLAHVRVPGRMELLETADPNLCALVDYAHNKLSDQRFFSSVSKEFAGRKVIALFGAPGDKALERRRELPEEASRWADFIIYTEEDPAHERVEDICAELAANTPEGQAFEVICDRPAAIARAVELALQAPEGAVVCLLAKGDETRQHEGDRFVPCETDGAIFTREMARQQPSA
ncbi:MAG: UDP-N-acetylmuramoyl-L-alanyl-D-glutamate--2,6-diaminopimelate ligase [Atopobiaceae bacterium]|nr:UDP-N-acetylmuramoyl-L-alanyl-D-glutamate--2,6-diaminopimelate ligase [Atopobiaceae bacterium]